MKQKKIAVVIISSAFLLVLVMLNCFENAKYTYDDQGFIRGIEYKDAIYNRFDYIDLNPRFYLITSEHGTSKHLILHSNINDFFFPVDYFSFYSNKYDELSNFIVIHNSATTVEEVFVRENFIMPSLQKCEIDAVWFSLNSSDGNHINETTMVNKIVGCAKSNGEKELDKEIYDYIVENSWDNHCIYLKYEGYPLVEEFFVTETEDGRYIVDQYTAEEYDSIYYNEH